MRPDETMLLSVDEFEELRACLPERTTPTQVVRLDPYRTLKQSLARRFHLKEAHESLAAEG